MSQRLHDTLSGLLDDMKAAEDAADRAVTFIKNLPNVVASAVEHALGAVGADDETLATEVDSARATMQNHVQPLIDALAVPTLADPGAGSADLGSTGLGNDTTGSPAGQTTTVTGTGGEEA